MIPHTILIPVLFVAAIVCYLIARYNQLRGKSPYFWATLADLILAGILAYLFFK